MKTDQIQNKGNLSYRSTDRPENEAKGAEEAQKKKKSSEAEAVEKKDRERKEIGDNHLDAVKKMIGENIEWRQMRFYRNEKDGKTYIDIVNRETGEVIRTVPEPEMHKIATQFKHLSGMTLDING